MLVVTQCANIALTADRLAALVAPIRYRNANHMQHVLGTIGILFAIGITLILVSVLTLPDLEQHVVVCRTADYSSKPFRACFAVLSNSLSIIMIVLVVLLIHRARSTYEQRNSVNPADGAAAMRRLKTSRAISRAVGIVGALFVCTWTLPAMACDSCSFLNLTSSQTAPPSTRPLASS